jgi:putative nucleotidyltransferase with HDIG domain
MHTEKKSPQQEDQLLALMGLGAQSGKKSHYPELKRRLAELERVQALLDRAQDAIFVVSLPDETVEYRNESALRLRGSIGREEKRPLEDFLKGADGRGLTIRSCFDAFPAGEERKILPLLTEGGIRRFEASFMSAETEGQLSGVLILRDQEDRIRAEERLAESLRQVEQARMRTVHLTATLVEIKDSYTGKNQRQAAGLAHAIGTDLGLKGNTLENLVTATLLHDVGMMAIPAEILCIPGPLRPVDRRLMQEHASIGCDILKKQGFPPEIYLTVLSHHERLDGSGYPQGLKGDDIPLGARIAGLADVVEAMLSHRPYRPAWPLEKVLEELSANRGILYDPDAAEACRNLLEKGYTLDDGWFLKR